MTDENSGESQEDDAKVLYEQLQTEYNKLLKQYAAAENTIDELRTGATVHLYTQPLQSRPNSRLSFESERCPQTITFPKALQTSTSSVSAINEACSKNPTGGHSFLSQDKRVKLATQGENTSQNVTLHARIQALKEDVNNVECLLSENAVNEGLINEVVVICTQLRKEHGTLTHELQSQNVDTCHLSQCDTHHLCTKTELGKELYRLGLRVDEIQRDVTARVKANNTVSNSKSVKPQSNDKPQLNSDIQILIKEMKNLKDASIRSSEEVLNSSRMENMKSESDSPFKKSSKRSNEEQRRHSEHEHDIVDSQYLSASPVNLEFDSQNILSGSEGSGSCGEQICNVTWPPSRNKVDIGSSKTLHSFSETTHDYGHGSVKSSQRSLNSAHDHKSLDSESSLNATENKRRTNPNEQLTTPRSISDRVEANKSQSGQVQLPANHLKSNGGPKIPQITEDDRTVSAGTNSKPKDSTRRSWERHSSQFAHDPHKYKAERYSENTPYSDDDFSHKKERQSLLPKRPENCNQGTKHRRSRSSDGNPGPEHFNSLSSLADSSRMSTPLFLPRAAMRHAPPSYKRRNLSDGFDSGFVGSEASRSSRLTTGHSDGIQKLNVSNQLDSNLHLDFVSEMDEYESTSPEKVSTTYEDGRQSPKETMRSRQFEDSNFIHSSPSPPSSTGRTPSKYFAYRTSRTGSRSGENSSPGCDASHSDKSLSCDSERHSSDDGSFSEHRSGFEGTSTKTMDKAGIRYRGSGTRDVAPEVLKDDNDKVKSQDKASETKNERKLQALRDELDSLHHHVNELDDPRDIMGRYAELRQRDEQLRRVQEGRNERKLDDLRQTIEQLKRDIKLRYRSENRRRKPDLDPEFYDDFRRELRYVTDKLNELTNLRICSHGPSVSPYTHVSSKDEDDDIAKRFSSLVRKVDELRLRIENGAARENSRYFCRHCNEVGGHHYGNGTVNTADHQPRRSTPFLSDIHPTSGQTTIERSHLSSTYPGAYHSPVIHHVHTYHRDPRLTQHIGSESSSDEDNYTKRSPLHRRRLRRSRHRSRRDISNYDHFSLDDARKAARDVQRLSKNILNSITLDLTSLQS